MTHGVDRDVWPHRDDDQVGDFGKFCEIPVAAMAGNLVVVRIDRIDLAAKSVTVEIDKRLVTEVSRTLRRPDQGDRPGIDQPV